MRFTIENAEKQEKIAKLRLVDDNGKVFIQVLDTDSIWENIGVFEAGALKLYCIPPETVKNTGITAKTIHGLNFIIVGEINSRGTVSWLNCDD